MIVRLIVWLLSSNLRECMIAIRVSEKKMIEQNVQCFGFLVPEGAISSLPMKECAEQYGLDIEQYLAKQNFGGKILETWSLPLIHEGQIYRIIVVGLGSLDAKGHCDVEQYRRALAHLCKQVAAYKEKSVAVYVPHARLFQLTPRILGQESAVIVHMALYTFDDYVTNPERKEPKVAEIILSVAKDRVTFAQGVQDGEIIARSVNTARHWIDLPPMKLTPVELADRALAIAKKTGLKCTIFNEEQINQKGMGGLAAVGLGSEQESRLAILEYHPKKKSAQTIALVGKGITFDSGGLSIKPAQYMETMKDDMSGAAAVIVTMEALSYLKPDIHVIGVIPLAENLPSGKATKPGDIVTFYNGKTAEIRNTDAEGRLILADALSYTVKHYKVDAIIDIATLTGACAHALGPFFSGLMSQHDDLVTQIEKAAERTGDRVWRLPLHDDYKVAIKSDVADLCNIGNPKYMAGAITAAHFLKEFVGDVPWAHLDIAGTAFNVPDIPYFRTGATGAGIRLFINLVMNWKR